VAEQPAAGAGLFDALGSSNDFQVDLLEDAGGAPLVEPPAHAGGGAWPSNIPGPIESADALGRGLAGKIDPPGTPFGPVADVLAHLTELEHAVLSGAPQPIDTEAIRRAAVMRVRVAVALATAPAPGGEVDVGAVSALLGDIDALLSDVNALAAAAPAEVQPALEQVRNALVKEAIDFSEAAHRVQPAEPIPAAEPQPTAPRGRAAQTRVVSVASKAEVEADEHQQKRQRRYWSALAVAVAAAAAFHGYSYVQGKPVEIPLGVGALSNAASSDVPGGRMVRAPDGGAFDPAELKRFAEDEALKGNSIREIRPGVVLVMPAVRSSAQLAAPDPARVTTTTSSSGGTATGASSVGAAAAPGSR
jgi:hypothetical protein